MKTHTLQMSNILQPTRLHEDSVPTLNMANNHILGPSPNRNEQVRIVPIIGGTTVINPQNDGSLLIHDVSRNGSITRITRGQIAMPNTQDQNDMANHVKKSTIGGVISAFISGLFS